MYVHDSSVLWLLVMSISPQSYSVILFVVDTMLTGFIYFAKDQESRGFLSSPCLIGFGRSALI